LISRPGSVHTLANVAINSRNIRCVSDRYTQDLCKLLSFEEDRAVQFVEIDPAPRAHAAERLLRERFARRQPLGALEQAERGRAFASG
jgi:hypothetical protein